MLPPALLAIVIATASPAPKHWAFVPPRPVPVPASTARHPIDAFLGAAPSPAEKRTLIRRATFDLTGLPPTPQEIAAFLSDTRPDAFERVIERLLASAAYGEKWGRLWLDVVRYADTAGETADFPAPDAWRYRNYVIDAFNADKPYDRFLREQIAGDLLPATDDRQFREQVIATGYLAISRRFGFDIEKDHFLTIEDTIDTLGKSVLGLTLACARCHDHKYDPITNRDYYALYGIFDSTRYPFPGCEKNKSPRDGVTLVPPSELQRQRDEAMARVARAEQTLAQVETRVKEKAAQPARKLKEGGFANGGPGDTFELSGIKIAQGQMLRLTVAPRQNNGADSTLIEFDVREQGGMQRRWNLTDDLLRDVHQHGRGCLHDDHLGNKAVWSLHEGTETPRLLAEYLNDAEKTPGLHAWRGSEPYAALFANTNAKDVAFQTVRMPARTVALHPGAKTPVTLAWQSPIDGVITIRGQLRDLDPSGGDGISWTLAQGPGYAGELAATLDSRRALTEVRTAMSAQTANLPVAYAVAEGKPHHVPVQKRGDPDSPGEVVPRGMPVFLNGQPVKSAARSSGRLELAEWLTAPTHPLTARVMMNRIWQGHFGRGLVTTPNDFGTRGALPTHPPLLDWLALRFIDSGWKIKAMHRLIMTSAAYQRQEGMRRRLTGEEVRDALLAVSGDLDRVPGEAHPFPPAKSWNFTQHGPFIAVYDHQKRSVYLMTQRIKRHPFLALFDGPDPNASIGRRETSTVPTQALYFLNDPFVHARAASLARRLAVLPEAERLQRASELLYGRPPRADEIETARQFTAGGDWPGWFRVMLAANEFVYVD